MSERGHQLAAAFDRMTNRLVDRVREASDEQWTTPGNENGWTVAQEALHIAAWMEIEADLISRLAGGRRIILPSSEAVDALNARLVADVPEPTKHQVLLEIAGNRTLARHFLIGLTDQQLDRALPVGAAFL